MKITTKDLTKDSWNDVVTLFGSNGACGGCWCQAWRFENGEKWKEIEGAAAKERLYSGIKNGSVYAVIAYDETKPVGWCTYGPRLTFPRIGRARTLKCDDAESVWSLPCFFVLRGYRRQGVSSLMLNHALKTMQKLGVKIAEGYPSKPDKDGKYIDTFAFTGTQSLFAKAGFVLAGSAAHHKQRVRKILD
jgi:GNAT superfamily N-acetyltransferase